MDLTSFSINFTALFIGTVSTTWALTDSTDGHAIRVWDQFGEHLRKIEDLNEKGVWDKWVERWVYLVVSSFSQPNKKIETDYWKEKVLEQDIWKKFLDEKSGKKTSSAADDKERVAEAQKDEYKTTLKPAIKRLQDECKWAYGRYINKDVTWEKSWLNSWSIRTKGGENKSENYKYWKDVFIGCSDKGDNNSAPFYWLSSSSIHLYEKNDKTAQNKS
ncbi:hypothetical protein [Candidatus Mycoplasma haematohominis]|uniref:hypothetical protein n=1 Tax=Candidatus Mycoplasma haematohominis TaxID=1494318 RepID=UPI001C0A6D57|nr:hypothetical protein [Candidatus Mycoplasma haemohominis]